MVVNSHHKNIQKNIYLRLFIAIAIIIAVTVLLISVIIGKSTTTGDFPANIKTIALECTSSKQSYDKLDKQSSKGDIRAVGIFNELNNLIKLSFEYKLSYADHNAAEADEPYLRGNFAKNLEKDGLPYDKFNNKFSIYQNTITLTLFVEPEDLNLTAAYYFLLDSNRMPSTLLELQSRYEKRGFNCTSTADN